MCTQPNYAMYIKPSNPEEKGHLKFILKLDTNFRSLKQRYGDFLISLPCGKCEECRKNYATEWATRCELEARKSKGKNWFITLTYDNKHMPKDGRLKKEDIQEFIDLLVNDGIKGHATKKKDFKYWIAGEYGPLTNRPHYHGIIFNLELKDIKSAGIIGKVPVFESEKIRKAWKNGYYVLEEANGKAAAYCAKYANKSSGMNFRPLMSKGLGLEELYKEKDFIIKYGYIQGANGRKLKIPRYFYKKFIEDQLVQQRKMEQIQIGIERTSELQRFEPLEKKLKEKDILHKKQKGRRSKI